MTFWYDSEDDELVGNRLMEVTEIRQLDIDDMPPEVRIDVSAMMETGRGVSKLREMQNAITDAIEAHEGGDVNE